MSDIRRFIPAFCALLIEGALQLSGYQSPTLSILLLCAVVAALLFGAWPWVRRVRFSSPIRLIAIPDETASPTTTTPARKRYTAYDLEKRIRAVDDLIEIINNKLRRLLSDAQRSAEAFDSRIQEGDAETIIVELEGQKEFAEKAFSEYYTLIYEMHTTYPEMSRIADERWPPRTIVDATGGIRGEIIRLARSGHPPSLLREFLQNNRYFHEWTMAINMFARWIDEKREMLTTLRRGYEYAEVYESGAR